MYPTKNNRSRPPKDETLETQPGALVDERDDGERVGVPNFNRNKAGRGIDLQNEAVEDNVFWANDDDEVDQPFKENNSDLYKPVEMPPQFVSNDP